MAGVYGDFIEAFPEAFEGFYVWRKDDRSDRYTIRAMYMPGGGDSIKRRKYTSGNTGLDVTGEDDFYVTERAAAKLQIGDYVQALGSPEIMRLTKLLPFGRLAGYRLYRIERVTGTTVDKTEDLHVKEAVFA